MQMKYSWHTIVIPQKCVFILRRMCVMQVLFEYKNFTSFTHLFGQTLHCFNSLPPSVCLVETQLDKAGKKTAHN